VKLIIQLLTDKEGYTLEIKFNDKYLGVREKTIFRLILKTIFKKANAGTRVERV
jgi:hypothetical protein